MNIYNDDAIFLSGEAANAFVSSLLLDRESLSLRDKFISDIEQNISFSDDGSSIVVDVPDIDLVDSESYVPVKTAVCTREINIQVSTTMVVSTYYYDLNMQCYNKIDSDNHSKYVMSKKTQSEQWYTGTKVLNNVA